MLMFAKILAIYYFLFLLQFYLLLLSKLWLAVSLCLSFSESYSGFVGQLQPL